MRYAGIIENDFVNGLDVCVSYWAQGCPIRCPHCHNPQTWEPDGGYEATEEEIIDHILTALTKNGIQRNFSVLGGEPLSKYNIEFTAKLLKTIKTKYPNTVIYLWTGYYYDELDLFATTVVQNYVNILIDGPYKHELRDVTLLLRGSSNQHIHYLQEVGENAEKVEEQR